MRRTWVIVGAVVGVIVVVLLILLATGVFKGSSDSLQSQMVGPKWKVTSITTNGTEWKAPSTAKMELTFTDTNYSGNDGCNVIGGEVTFQDKTVTMKAGISTLIACSDPVSEMQTTAFHALTAGPAGAVVSGSTLTLTGGTTVVAYTKS